jgi:hypothetical protein
MKARVHVRWSLMPLSGAYSALCAGQYRGDVRAPFSRLLLELCLTCSPELY